MDPLNLSGPFSSPLSKGNRPPSESMLAAAGYDFPAPLSSLASRLNPDVERTFKLKALPDEAIASALKNAAIMVHRDMSERARERNLLSEKDAVLDCMLSVNKSDQEGRDCVVSAPPAWNSMNTSKEMDELDQLLSNDDEWLKTI